LITLIAALHFGTSVIYEKGTALHKVYTGVSYNQTMNVNIFTIILVIFLRRIPARQEKRILLNDPDLILGQIHALESKYQDILTKYNDLSTKNTALSTKVADLSTQNADLAVKYRHLSETPSG
jgi:hypothetical protein